MKYRYFALIGLCAVLALTSSFGVNLVNAATFPGAGVGAIPDSSAGPQAPGAPLNVTFNVTGISGAPTSVSVDMTLNPAHTWAGDVVATLIAPNGTSFVIFGYTGATTTTSFGDNSDLAGPYTFNDAATGGWWAAATTAGSTVPIAAGSYRTSTIGGTSSGGTATNLTAAFAAIPTSNGTWTLRFTDGGAGDTGSVSAASLTLTGGVAVSQQHVVDFNGDGKTDFSVVRNAGGNDPSGQLTWYNQYNGAAGNDTVAFGLGSDFVVPGDFDGDNKSDISVWRPGAAGSATWYTLQSATSTLRIETFGQTGDDPTVIGDYDGDGKDDIAVYRAGATGAQSTWFYRTVLNGPIYYVPWGVGGDFVAPGDYDGDGKNDFSVQRNGGGGQAVFITRLSSTSSVTYNFFGLPTDLIVPGDYDGDGKTDYAVVRGSAGQIAWYYQPSSQPSTPYVLTLFGASATDAPVPGDYDGDGKTDQAVWRPNVDPNQNYFYVNNSSGGLQVFEWGQNGDYPTAFYNTH